MAAQRITLSELPPDSSGDRLVNGALIALGVLAIGDNVVFHWLLQFHRFKDGWPGSLSVEIALVAIGVGMVLLGVRRETQRHARRRGGLPQSARTDVTSPQRYPLRMRLRYLFDNTLATGPVALIGWLAAVSLLIIVVAAVVLVAFGIAEGGGQEVGVVEAGWQALMRTLDPGTMGFDVGWGFRLVMLTVTIGGILVVSTLIGVITTGMQTSIAELRKGRSPVLEIGHTLVIGWSRKIFKLLAELAMANENVRRPRVVVLADHDKVAMEEDIRARLGGGLGRTRVICRSGDPLSGDTLVLGNPAAAKSIVVLGPDGAGGDPFVLRALLALTQSGHRAPRSNPVVAMVEDPRILHVGALVGQGDIQLVSVHDFIARVIAQTCRQSGLSAVYTELLSFRGDEIYFASEPALVGGSYGAALLAYEDSSVIGIRRASGAVEVNPPSAAIISQGDEIIAVSTDDDTIRLPDRPVAAPDGRAIVEQPAVARARERTLVLGWNDHGDRVVRELDAYVASGSHIDIVDPDGQVTADGGPAAALDHTTVAWHAGDPSDGSLLASFELAAYDHVILLAEVPGTGADASAGADTRTLLSLLHLRDLAERHGYRYSIVTEIVDSRNRELAQGAHADDFVVSDELVSLLLAQVSERAPLNDVFATLFDAAGSEIYLRPAGDYVVLGRPVTFATVVQAGMQRGETAIGYRSAADAGSAERQFGVTVNPAKSHVRTWTSGDRIIVLAES